MDGSQGLLNTPQRYQQVSRQALREVIQNAEDSPRRRLPAPRPETPTPLPGYVERRRANVRSDHRGSRNGDPQSSPRRRRPNDARGENTAPFAAHTTSIPQCTPATPGLPQLSRRSIAQQARRLREREMRALSSALPPPQPTAASAPLDHHPPLPRTIDIPNARSLGQRRRRERERGSIILPNEPAVGYESAQQPTPPSTQVNYGIVRDVSNQEERQQPGPQRERCLEQTRQELSSNAAPSPAQPPTPPSTQVVSRSDQQPNVQGDRFIPPTTQQVQQAQPAPNVQSRPSGQQAPRDVAAIQARTAPLPQTRTRNANGRQRNQDLFLAARRPYQEPASRHDLGRMDIECSHCRALHWKDEKLAQSSARNPEFGMCCNSGKVSLPLLRDPPQALKTLLDGDDVLAKDFRENIWKYNRAFAFTSLKANEDRSVNFRPDGTSRGPPVFRIQGELYHRGGSLSPADPQKPTYAQLYIYDPQAALEHRRRNNEGLNHNTLETLQNMLLQHHQYVQVYRHAYELLGNYDPNEDVSIRLRVSPNLDRRRYNLPTADEVAVILPRTGDPAENNSCDIILHRRGGALQVISDLHPAYVPLYYVLLFPYGENGWHPDLQLHGAENQARKRLTQSRFVAYRLQVRRNEYSALLRGGRLLQRFLVDMYASIDQNRLYWFVLNQPTIRACLYSGLEDAVAAGDDEIDLHSLGQKFILPSSYIGGPRHMQQRFQDSMAIARYYRQVDIFMTVTTNPEWEEITRELLPGQTAYDRPDLVARVFQMKKKAILDHIYKHGVFGHAVAYIYTIEFQKRGLPHMHCLIFLKEPYKLTTTDAIDSCIWARWPDPETQPLLFETVMRCMVHGPCGAANPNAPCMENGKCTKGFPKTFAPFTTMDEHGFPVYFRPDDGRSYFVRGIWVDNRWIVPYCPYLSATFNCHINVECAASLGSFKYLFKYIQKGPDLASLEINHRDEIKRYTNGRYISPTEATHRVYHFDTHDQIPNVVRLQVHLPGQHMVVFDPDEDAATIVARASHERTTLTAYFEANADNGALGSQARKYTYQEFPQHFVWKAPQKKWAIRQRDFAIGRMYFVPPTAGERFYLRTLLTVVKGATSFEQLRRYNGQEYPTFHAACVARGLLEDDGEWRQCLEEASQMQTGTRLRHLFATLLLFCVPAQPDQLWTEFRHHICDDLHYRLRTMDFPNPTDEDVYDYGLYLLDNILKDSGHSLEDWPSMPKPQQQWDGYRLNRLIAEQLDYDRNSQQRYHDDHLPLLNAEQRHAYNRIIESVDNENGQMLMVNGPGGTGKTFVYKVICSKFRARGDVVLCVASSGIAALLLPGGRTAHSMFKIPVDNLTSESLCSISKNTQRADLLRYTKCIIWDEIVPQNRNAIEALDRTLRDLRDNGRPFGGITTLFGGDFQQTLPVVQKGTRAEIVDATLTRSYLWPDIEVIHLHQNMRLQGDPDAENFAQWLLDIGHGRNSDESGKVKIPHDMLASDTESLINYVYPDIDSSPPPPPEYFLNRMILAPRNTDVNDVNEAILNCMDGEEAVYYSADQVIEEEGADGHDNLPLSPEFLRSVNSSSLPPGELKVKKGCPLILLRNLSPSNGLCNGTRMIVTRLSQRVLEVRLIGGDHDGEIALIPRISLTPTSLTDFTFKIRRRQFPVRLAFAMTINKAQGQSVKIVGLDMRIPVFAHGQLYVALSRATSRGSVRVLLPHDAVDLSTMNVVYDEVLLD